MTLPGSFELLDFGSLGGLAEMSRYVYKKNDLSANVEGKTQQPTLGCLPS